MPEFDKYVKKARSMGITKARIIDPKSVVVGDWVRLKCQYGCGGYGKRLTCPPYSPTPDYTRKMLGEYSAGLLMQVIDISFDTNPDFSLERIVTDLEREIFLDNYYKVFGMAAGPCGFCRTCETEEPCKHPYDARPAMEACGIDVYATARNNGFELNVVTKEDSPCSLLSLILIK